MRPFLLLIGLAACTPTLTGEQGFPVGRAQLVPCEDEGGDPGAILIVESLTECWPSTAQERFTCEQHRTELANEPRACSDNRVVYTPSRSTLTGYFGPPIDPDNYLAASTARMWDLPCNPEGAIEDPQRYLERFLVEYTGDVRVTEDSGDRVQIDLELYREGAAEPSLEGSFPALVCR